MGDSRCDSRLNRQKARRVSHFSRCRAALRLLEVAGISPLSRPRVLAAARAIGTSLTLNDWYQGAWELEQSGRYRRRGNGESEWLEPVSSGHSGGAWHLAPSACQADQAGGGTRSLPW